jgi:hypothetical protein
LISIGNSHLLVHRFSGSGCASAIVRLQKSLHVVLSKALSVGWLAFAKLTALNDLIGSSCHLLRIAALSTPERCQRRWGHNNQVLAESPATSAER